MKKVIISAIVLSLASIGCTNEKQDKSFNKTNYKKMEQQDKEKIKEVIKVYFNSLNTASVAQAVAQYTKNGIFMPKDAPTSIGVDQLNGAYQHVFSTLEFIGMDFAIDELTIDGNLAIVRTSSLGNVKIKANGIIIEGATHRELFVMERVSSEWKIARYMFNTTAPVEH